MGELTICSRKEVFILAFVFLRFVSCRRGERAIIPPESLLCTERTGTLRGDGLAGHYAGLQGGGGVGGGAGDNSMLGYISKHFSRQHRRVGDHVMTDGNVLLQQHELVMKHLIRRRGATNPFFLLPSDCSAVNKKLMSWRVWTRQREVLQRQREQRYIIKMASRTKKWRSCKEERVCCNI